jgi:hypothetical protein
MTRNLHLTTQPSIPIAATLDVSISHRQTVDEAISTSQPPGGIRQVPTNLRLAWRETTPIRISPDAPVSQGLRLTTMRTLLTEVSSNASIRFHLTTVASASVSPASDGRWVHPAMVPSTPRPSLPEAPTSRRWTTVEPPPTASSSSDAKTTIVISSRPAIRPLISKGVALGACASGSTSDHATSIPSPLDRPIFRRAMTEALTTAIPPDEFFALATKLPPTPIAHASQGASCRRPTRDRRPRQPCRRLNFLYGQESDDIRTTAAIENH